MPCSFSGSLLKFITQGVHLMQKQISYTIGPFTVEGDEITFSPVTYILRKALTLKIHPDHAISGVTYTYDVPESATDIPTGVPPKTFPIRAAPPGRLVKSGLASNKKPVGVYRETDTSNSAGWAA